MSESSEAKLLADWLQSPPGTPAPEGLDAEVVAGVYALRPDLAPPLRLTLDEVLGSVSAGPFAGAAAARKDSARVAARVDPRSSVEPRRDASSRAAPKRPWWAIPGVGLVVAAAAVTLIAVRVGSGLTPESPEVARLSEMPAAAPVAGAGDAMATKPLEADGVAPDGVAPEGVGRPDVAPEPFEEGLARAPQTAAPGRAESLAPTGASGAASGAVSASDAPAASDTIAETLADGDASAAPVAAPAAPGAAAPPPEPSGGYGQVAAEATAPAEKRSSAKAAAKPSADKADAAPVSAAKEEEQDRYRAAADEAQGSNVAPRDYNSSFYSAYPDIAAAYSAAIRLEASGRYTEAVSAFAGFLSSARTDVAQDAAWHVGRSLRALGRVDDALTTVSAGLRRGSTNTPYRANLYALQGDLYSAQGRSAEAQKAWAEAARLNAARR